MLGSQRLDFGLDKSIVDGGDVGLVICSEDFDCINGNKRVVVLFR